MKHLLLASLITLLAFGTACGQASEPAPEPIASDGIQVHGHWTVTVTNPDGTLDAVHEFDNDLTEQGMILLTALLEGTATINTGGVGVYTNGWAINLVENDQSTWDFHCIESGSPWMGNTNVVRDLPTQQTDPALRIIADCTVAGVGTSDISIIEVGTMAALNEDIAFEYGSTNVLGTFSLTEAVINPIPVKDAQRISVNVEISFS